jgi:DNA-binding XRE family transcriptional regulator
MKKMDELEELKKFKKKTGMSFEKIAFFLGVHSQTIMGWFHDKYKPSALAQKAIREFLKKHSSREKK